MVKYPQNIERLRTTKPDQFKIKAVDFCSKKQSGIIELIQKYELKISGLNEVYNGFSQELDNLYE